MSHLQVSQIQFKFQIYFPKLNYNQTLIPKIQNSFSSVYKSRIYSKSYAVLEDNRKVFLVCPGALSKCLRNVLECQECPGTLSNSLWNVRNVYLVPWIEIPGTVECTKTMHRIPCILEMSLTIPFATCRHAINNFILSTKARRY